MTKKNANAWKIPTLALLAALLLTAALLWAPKAYAAPWDPPKISLKEGCYYDTQYVTITCDSSDWRISYTTDGSYRFIVEPVDPTGSSSVTVPIDQSCVLRAVAYTQLNGSYTYSEVASCSYCIFERDHAPVITPESGLFRGFPDVTISCEEGWEIVYTVFDTPDIPEIRDMITYELGVYVPAGASIDYNIFRTFSNSVSFSAPTNIGIRAIACKPKDDGTYRFSTSADAGYYYRFKNDPEFILSLAGTTLTEVIHMVHMVPNEGYEYVLLEEGYTQEPIFQFDVRNISSNRLVIQGDTIEGEYADCFCLIDFLNGMAIEPGFNYHLDAIRPYRGLAAGRYDASYKLFINNGEISADIFLFVTAARPEFSLAPGTYIGPQQVSLSTITQGATIRYTTDGSTPNANSPVYTGPITITESTTVKAIACMDDAELNSNVVSAAYTIIPPSHTLSLSAPEFDEAEEGYDQPAAKPLTVVSTGNSDAAITSVGFLEGGAYFLLNKTDGATVAAGSTDDSTYTVRPAEGLKPGSYRTVVAVTYNDGKVAAAELNFTVRERRYEVRVYIPEEDSDLGGVTIIGPDTAYAGSRVTFTAWMNNDYYDEYQLTDVLVTDTSGNRIEVDYWNGFVMPASAVWVRPVFEPLLPITIELGDEVDLPMGIQTDSHAWGADNAKAAAGETVKLVDLMICDNEYVLASVTVTAEDESNVPCERYSESFTDEDGIHTETGWRFVMPGQSVTVRFVLVPVFDEADFVLPAELRIIEANAFEGDVSISAVDAGGCISVGEEAFKNCAGLLQIRLPYYCRIDPTAFDDCGTVYVYAPSGGTTENSCVRIANCIFIAEDTDSPLQ